MTTPLDRGQWTDARVETVVPGVHRIALPLPNDGLRAVNVYALEEDDGVILIDGGWAVPESRKRLEEALAVVGHDLGEITDILVTHIHRDHYTQAVDLRRLVGARVHLGVGERRSLEMLGELRSNSAVSTLALLRRCGASELAERIEARLDPDGFDASHWEAPDRWLGSETLRFGRRSLRVVPTPGHTRGHVVYLDEAHGLLFSGDHVLPHITPSIGFELNAAALPLGDYLDSLRLMTRFPDTRLLPAHGPVSASVHTRVAQLQVHHQVRLDQTLAALGSTFRHAHAVARRLRWTRREMPFDDLNDFNRMLAVSETAAHLDVLAVRGKVVTSVVDSVVFYTRTPAT
ncbi:MBL fold metallo-hydrolase [Streptomyces spiralis]|uniref:MBL fold metallo-hydrolase n=1 Tax=Streptomyces spiralis TaxID=66376 RepID=UPI0033FF583F